MSTALITQRQADFINNYNKVLIVRYYYWDVFGSKVDDIIHGFAKMARQIRKAAKMIGETWLRFARENKDIMDLIKEYEIVCQLDEHTCIYCKQSSGYIIQGTEELEIQMENMKEHCTSELKCRCVAE